MVYSPVLRSLLAPGVPKWELSTSGRLSPPAGTTSPPHSPTTLGRAPPAPAFLLLFSKSRSRQTGCTTPTRGDSDETLGSNRILLVVLGPICCGPGWEEGVGAWFPGSGALKSLVSSVTLRASFQMVNWMTISKSPLEVLVLGRDE